jgi:hypothetical protein
MSRNTRASRKWGMEILLCLIAAFITELAGNIILLFGSGGWKLPRPYTLHTIWLLAALAGALYLLHKKKVILGYFAVYALVCGFIATAIENNVPNDVYSIGARYYGIESWAPGYPQDRGFLYRKSDPALQLRFAELKADSLYVEKEGFLFWQAGVARGYSPYLLREYPMLEDFLDHIELLVTVGPMTLVEIFMKAAMLLFPVYLLITIIWNVVSRQHLWVAMVAESDEPKLAGAEE